MDSRFPKEEMKSKNKNPNKEIPFRRLTMQLYWVARGSIPFIMYACNWFSQYNNCYNQELFNELLNLLRFLKKKRIPLRLICQSGGEIEIKFMCDANFLTPDSTSNFGVFGFVQGCLVYTDCQKISSIVTSSCESESHSIFAAAKASVYIRNWVAEVIDNVKLPMFIFNDNEAAVLILTTRSNSGRSKHFDVKLRYVTELFEKKQIVVAHIKRGENCADILTHALNRQQFEAQLVLLYGSGVKEFLYGGSYRSGGETKFGSSLTVIGFWKY
jgi:hypothetical protein